MPQDRQSRSLALRGLAGARPRSAASGVSGHAPFEDRNWACCGDPCSENPALPIVHSRPDDVRL